ncbi:uncharacterized protein [Cardiocondyla obscurior]|uniref:uncharacterized protein n=1 Tax=Cardiocondyla obscurior TaxID=286306 RepID=UPI0039657D83
MSQQGTAWIQQLNKNQVLAELKKRNIVCESSSSYDSLRELLRTIVKKEISKKSLNNSNPLEETSVSVLEESVLDEEDTMSNDGIKLQFSLQADNWENFLERLELYFVAKDIRDEKKAAQFLTRLDEEAFSLIKQLTLPDKLISKSYSELIKLMSTHLMPKLSEIMERCKFNAAKQEANELVADFAACLKKLATHCDFKKIKISLRDQFVSGLHNLDIKAALFRMEKLDFDTDFKESVAREAADKDASKSRQVLEKRVTKNEMFAIQPAC